MPNAVNSVIERMAQLSAPIAVTVQKSAVIDENTARVLLTYHGNERRGGLAASVAKTWDNKVRLAEGSAFMVEKEGANGLALVDAILKLNVPTKAYDNQSVKGMRVVTANVFADEDDCIWKVIGEDDARMLVQVNNEDLGEALKSRRSLSIATASVAYGLGESFTGGDVLLAYDSAAEKVRFMLACDGQKAYDPDREAIVAVAAEEVLINVEGQLREVGYTGSTEPLSADNMVQRHLDYMSKLYSTRGEYFQRLKTLVEDHFARRSVR